MADETQTATTETQSSPTQTDAATGGANATQQPGADTAGDDDSSIMGGAKADDGTGSDAEAGDQDAGDGETDKVEVPEAYELKVTTKAEDGSDVEVEIDQQLLTEATPILKDLKLTNEQANKIAPLALKVQERVLQAQADEFTALKTDWAKQAKQDEEIGGANWKQTETMVARALDTFGAASQIEVVDGKKVETNPFRALLNESGFGNHPEMIRMFRRIGEKVGEDTNLVRSEPAPVKLSRAEVLYPNDVPKGAK